MRIASLLAVPVVLFSCGGDDEPRAPSARALVLERADVGETYRLQNPSAEFEFRLCEPVVDELSRAANVFRSANAEKGFAHIILVYEPDVAEQAFDQIVRAEMICERAQRTTLSPAGEESTGLLITDRESGVDSTLSISRRGQAISVVSAFGLSTQAVEDLAALADEKLVQELGGRPEAKKHES